MEATGGGCSSNERVLPPHSTRTLHHPSFMCLYSHPGWREQEDIQTGKGWTPHTEFFYTDPTLSCGTRITNHVHERREFECFQLNTPPPITCASVAPPNRPDAFTSGSGWIRSLGVWRLMQRTQEEDQSITNLLQLHHAEPHVERCSSAPHTHQAQERSSTRSGDTAQFTKHWSHVEVQVANTLLTFRATSVESNVKPDLFPPERRRVLSTSEEEALSALLNLALGQKSPPQ